MVNKLKAVIVAGALLLGLSAAASGCHLKPHDVCRFYQGEGRPGDIDLYHWHSVEFSWNNNVYMGGYHCRVIRAGYPDITFCVAEKRDGDTDPLDTCARIHIPW